MKSELVRNAIESLRISIRSHTNAIGLPLDEAVAHSASLANVRPPPVPGHWVDKEYRVATVESTVEHMVAWQVRVNREQRGLTQRQLAEKMATHQSAISRLEDSEGGDVRLSTLLRAAEAFDCALVVRFVGHDQFAMLTADVHPDRLYAPSFDDLPLSAINVLADTNVSETRFSVGQEWLT